MATVTLTKSKKAVLFIDDSGNVHITSVTFLKGLLDGVGANFLALTRLPNKTNADRFKTRELGQEDPFGYKPKDKSKPLVDVAL